MFMPTSCVCCQRCGDGEGLDCFYVHHHDAADLKGYQFSQYTSSACLLVRSWCEVELEGPDGEEAAPFSAGGESKQTSKGHISQRRGHCSYLSTYSTRSSRHIYLTFQAAYVQTISSSPHHHHHLLHHRPPGPPTKPLRQSPPPLARPRAP